jgi:hypothetical protein
MFSKINNLYWHIRFNRNKSIKRRYYRYVAAEKKRLIESGVDMEYLRLYCRALSSRQNQHAESRLERYKKDHFASN